MSRANPWPDHAPGVVEFPSGARLRGRSWATEPVYDAEFGVVLGHRPSPPMPWPTTFVRWRDFWLPHDPEALAGALRQALLRGRRRRVEITCFGGLGRTGTALACAAVLDGVRSDDAVAFVRERYHPSAVETPWQRRFVRGFSAMA